MRSQLNKLSFLVALLGAVAIALPCLADKDGQKGGKGGRGEGGQGGRSAASGPSSNQGNPKSSGKSSAIQSTPRGFSGKVGKDNARKLDDGNRNAKVQSAPRDLPKIGSSKSQSLNNVPRTFRQDGVTVPNPNRSTDPRVARGKDRDGRDLN